MPTTCQQTATIDFATFITESARPEWDTFRRHAQECPSCSAEIQHWTMLEKTLRAVGQDLRDTHPAEELLVQFHNRPHSLTEADRDTLAQHLQQCRPCETAVSLLASFDFSRIHQWVAEAQSAPEKKESAIPRVIVQLAKAGLRLIESHLVPPLLDVQELLTSPTPAYRPTEEPATVNLNIATDQAIITVTVVREEEQIALNLTFRDASQIALAGQRVFLRRQGISVFSAKTDTNGELRPPRLKPDTYEVACPGLKTTFQLEFRA
ncbi:MAG: hypothetical protein HOP18_01040 [Deltaproteobacteria bacterium]|nr:hypothetical protein [Deltaproteobacteria bacterium]